MTEIDRRKTKTPEEVAAQVVQDATIVAQKVVSKATETAAELAAIKEERDERMTGVLSNALREVFGDFETKGRFIDINRIPLICQSIIRIHEDIKEINKSIKESNAINVSQKEFWPVKTLIYSLVGIILSGFITGLIILVWKM